MQRELVTFFRAAFLRHQPRRFAVMQPETADRKYDDFPGELTDAQIAAHLEGRAAYAVPHLHAGLGHLLAFDVDAGGLDAITALRQAAERRGLWAFATLDPATGRGYVWLPFEGTAAGNRLHALGEQLRSEVTQPGWRIENRASEADTRLPFARHAWTGRRGVLEYPGSPAHDLDPPTPETTGGAAPADPLPEILARFMAAYRENDPAQLPPPPETLPRATPKRSLKQPTGQGVTITAYNAATDLVSLLESYGAKRARGQGARLYFCPFHDDHRASLIVNKDGDRCHCYSAASGCPLSERQHDAFNVFCIGEHLTAQQALRRLNGLPEPGDRSQRPEARRTPRGQSHRSHTPPAGTEEHTGSPGQGQGPLPAQEARQRPTEARWRAEERREASSPALDPSHAPDAAQGLSNGLPKAARKVLAVIADHPRGYWRGKYHLADVLDLDPRTVQRSLRRLEAEGHITRTERGRDGQTDIYRVVSASVSYDTKTTDPTEEGAAKQVSAAPEAESQPKERAPEGRQMPPTENLESVPEGNQEKAAERGGGSPGWPSLPDLLPAEDGGYHGPAGAVAYAGGAAYVPPEAASWYAGLPLPESVPAPEAVSVLDVLEPEQVALPPAPALPPPPTPKRRRRKASPSPVDTGQLLGRIIAAERKAAKLAKGTAPERRQAQAIRREVERLKARLDAQRAHGYSPEECDQWLAPHPGGEPVGEPENERATPQHAAGGPPPLTSCAFLSDPANAEPVPAREAGRHDVRGMIERLRQRQMVSGSVTTPGSGQGVWT